VGKRKKKKKPSRKASHKLISVKDRKKRKVTQARRSLLPLLKILLLVGVIGCVAVGLAFLDRYVRDRQELFEKVAALDLVNAPSWVSGQLKNKIYAAAKADGENLKLDEEAAASVQQNIETYVAWLDNVQVTATHDSLRIEGIWRKPLALIAAGSERFYVDVGLVVLDYVPVPALPIVEITGVSVRQVPPIGSVFERSDVAAAVSLLEWLDKMDSKVSAKKPLLFDIDSIDVSNFSGRRDKSEPHIVLYAKDGTKIIWGAEIGTWQRYLEAMDKDKIAGLYEYYRQHGTLLGGARYINLRYPQDGIVQPVDEY
jgi:hypothetical protein